MRYIYLGKRLKCSVFLPPLIFLFCVSAGLQRSFSAFAAVILHEAGHITAGLILKRKISYATLSALGADIEYTGAASYKADIITALCGPVFSLISRFLLCGVFYEFAVISVIYGLMNLIPVPCFDGGRALRGALYSSSDITVSERICDAVSVFCLIIMYLFSVFLLFYTSFNASLLFLCAYVFFDSYIKMK